MGKYKTIMLTLLVVFAFSAVGAATASATELTLPIWLTTGGEKVAEAKPVLIDGTLILHVKKISALFGGGEILVECNGEFHGTVGPEMKDEITSILDLEGHLNKVSCTVSHSTNTVCTTGKLITVEPVDLPWPTELIKGEPATDLTKEGTKGEIGYSSTCEGIKDKCTSKTESSTFLGNKTTGAEFTFLAATIAKCTFGEGSILGSGIVLGFDVS